MLKARAAGFWRNFERWAGFRVEAGNAIASRSRLMDHPDLVTIFGGSGFVGTQVVQLLARAGYRVRVAVRRPDLAGHLRPLGNVGQVVPMQANLRNADSVMAAVRGASVVINLLALATPLFMAMLLPLIFNGAGKFSLDALMSYFSHSASDENILDLRAWSLGLLVIAAPLSILLPAFGLCISVLAIALAATSLFIKR